MCVTLILFFSLFYKFIRELHLGLFFEDIVLFFSPEISLIGLGVINTDCELLIAL